MKTKTKKKSAKKVCPIGTIFWLIHHETLLEPLGEPLNDRIDYIKTSKPINEREIRLNWMRPVKCPSKLPVSLRRAAKRVTKEWNKEPYSYAYWSARSDFSSLTRRHEPLIRRLHKKECPGCPFDYVKGTLIFPAL